MGEYETVDGLLDVLNLSKEELQVHQELIDACRQNEQKLIEYHISTQQNIEKLYTILDTMYERMSVLSVAVDDLVNEAESLSLKMLPADKFYRE